MTLLDIRSLCKSYKDGNRIFPVLQNVCLGLKAGEFCAITGTSGSGKTTLMNLVGLLDRPDSGDILFKGKSTATLSADETANFRNKSLGFVFQSFHLISRLSLLDNVALPLIYRGMPRSERREQAKIALEKVGLAQRGDSTPDKLSGGQRQRVAIARAIVANPDLLLADEPTGNLDTQTAQDILALFFDLNRSFGATILMITHDRQIAEQCSRQVLLMDGEIHSDCYRSQGNQI